MMLNAEVSLQGLVVADFSDLHIVHESCDFGPIADDAVGVPVTLLDDPADLLEKFLFLPLFWVNPSAHADGVDRSVFAGAGAFDLDLVAFRFAFFADKSKGEAGVEPVLFRFFRQQNLGRGLEVAHLALACDPHILGGEQVDLPVDDLESLDVGPGRPALGVSTVEKIDPLTGEVGGGKGEGNQARKQGEFHGITVANGRVMQRQKQRLRSRDHIFDESKAIVVVASVVNAAAVIAGDSPFDLANPFNDRTT